MKKIMLIVFISVTLFSQMLDNSFIKNPSVYSSLGDKIYNSLSNVNNLKNIESFTQHSLKIHKYTVDVQETRKLGYEIESGNSLDKKHEYLEKLRELSKTNNHFHKMADESFKSSIENNNNKLFQSIVNSGMVDLNTNKDKIISYYEAHSDEINSSGVIQDIIDIEKELEKEKKLEKKRYIQSQKHLNKDKITRYREAQKRKDEAIEKKLEQELQEKKEQIREEQERQLFN